MALPYLETPRLTWMVIFLLILAYLDTPKTGPRGSQAYLDDLDGLWRSGSPDVPGRKADRDGARELRRPANGPGAHSWPQA